jgi:acyl-CoA thioester hydrolase
VIETYRGIVYPQQIDHMEHMNVQFYTAKFDEATWHLMSALGLTQEFMQKHSKGLAALEQLTKYKAEVRAGELLVIKSKVLEVKDKTIRFLHLMFNPETKKEAASTELVGVYMDLQSRKACPLPVEVKAKAVELFDIN